MRTPPTGVIAVGALSFEPASNADVVVPAPVWDNALLTATGAWLAGADAAICSVVPRDWPLDVIRRISRAGFDLSRVRLASDAEVDASRPLEPTAEQLASVGPNWAVHLLAISPTRQRELLTAVFQRVALTTIDIGYSLASWPLDRLDVLGLASLCDAVLFGHREANLLWPGKAPRDALRSMARSGARAAVIKLGPQGSIGIYEGTITWVPAFPIRMTPKWPIGDAFAGAFAAAFVQHRDLRRALAWAGAAASAVSESQSPLDLVNEYARRTVAGRAKLLEKETEQT